MKRIKLNNFINFLEEAKSINDNELPRLSSYSVGIIVERLKHIFDSVYNSEE